MIEGIRPHALYHAGHTRANARGILGVARAVRESQPYGATLIARAQFPPTQNALYPFRISCGKANDDCGMIASTALSEADLLAFLESVVGT